MPALSGWGGAALCHGRLHGRIGNPIRVGELGQAAFIGPSVALDLFVRELNRRGVPITHANIRHSTGSGLAAWEWVRRGLGIGAMMVPVARMTEGVVQVADMEPIPVPTWLVTHRELRTSRRIRVVFDVLAEVLGSGNAGLDD